MYTKPTWPSKSKSGSPQPFDLMVSLDQKPLNIVWAFQLSLRLARATWSDSIINLPHRRACAEAAHPTGLRLPMHGLRLRTRVFKEAPNQPASLKGEGLRHHWRHRVESTPRVIALGGRENGCVGGGMKARVGFGGNHGGFSPLGVTVVTHIAKCWRAPWKQW